MDLNQNLSPHFILKELVNSEEAIAHGFGENFEPSDAIMSNLKMLCVKVLEPLRDKLGKPIVISSGYRCPRLNQAVGGMINSQHLCISGNAAVDTTVPGMTTEDWYNFCRNSGIPIDEIIIEHDSKGDYWVHLSYDLNKQEQRGVCLTGTLKDSGGTVAVSDGLASFKQSA